VITGLNVTAPESPDRIHIEFTISGKGQGPFSGKIEYIKVAGDSRDPPVSATPAPESSSIDEVALDTPTSFDWDSKRDLGDETAKVQILVTPLRRGKPGQSFLSQVLRAGNTSASLGNIELASQQDRLFATFDLFDAESDPVELTNVEIAIEGDHFESLPRKLFEELPSNSRQNLPASPTGAKSSLSFKVTDLDSDEVPEKLRQAGRPGFVGIIKVRLSVRDFPTEDVFSLTSSGFRFDNNVAPFVEILPLQPGDLDSGIIPIRYRVFDPEKNSVNLTVEVNLLDGKGLQAASEFPAPASEGVSELCAASERDDCILDPGLFGNTGNPFHTFLWDALSQPFSGESVEFSVRARDKEDGARTNQVLTGFQLAPFARRKDLVAGDGSLPLATGDFDGDRALDLVVASGGFSKVSYLPGGADGLSQARIRDIGVELNPAALATGDFDGDEALDLVVANFDSMSVSYLRGKKEAQDGLSQERKNNVPVGLHPSALRTGDLDGDKILDLVVANSGTNTVTYLRGCQEGLSEARKQDFEVGISPIALATGDFDGNGSLDLAVVNTASFGEEIPGSVSYLPGGEGGPLLTSRVDIEIGVLPKTLAIGDFDGDGLLDLAVVTTASFGENTPGTLNYLRGGEGGLSGERKNDLTVGLAPRALSAGDFDGDGSLDLVAANAGSSTASLFSGSAAGLSDQGRRDLELPGSPQALATRDLDADGALDLVVANGGTNTLSYLRGGPGGLSADRRRETQVEGNPVALATGDFEGDGALDLAVIVVGSTGVVSYLRGAPGGFSQSRRLEVRVGTLPNSAATGDFDHDGSVDLVVVNGVSGTVSQLMGGADGLSEVRRADLQVGNVPVALEAGDFEGDGDLDLAVANALSDSISFFRGGSRGLPEEAKEIHVGSVPLALARGDFNGDNVLDLAVANFGSNGVTYLAGGKDGLAASPEIEVGTAPSSLVVGDFDLDGALDLVVANAGTAAEENPSPGSVAYLRGGDNGFSNLRKQTFEAGVTPTALAAKDFDGDGILDLAVANSGSNGLSYIAGTPDGPSASPKRDIGVGFSPAALADGDLDGDGAIDLVVANAGSGTITYLRGGGNGLSQDRLREIEVGPAPSKVLPGDFDGNATLDLVVANNGSNTVSYLRGGGDGLSGSRKEDILVGNGPSALQQGDFDRDGALDLVVVNGFAGSISYLPSRYLVPHVNCETSGDNLPGAPPCFVDPRQPSRYRLEALEATDASLHRVAIVPATTFEISPGESARENRFTVVTEAITLLNRDRAIESGARLTLRLKDLEPELIDKIMSHPEGLRAFRKGPQENAGVDLGVNPEIVDLKEGKTTSTGVRFRIERPGRYLVAFSPER
jgi:hypothetical protein